MKKRYCDCKDSHLIVPEDIKTAKCAYCNRPPYGVYMEEIREKRESFKEVVEPVIKWINDNCNPHSSIEITVDSAELKSGEIYHKTNIYIKD